MPDGTHGKRRVYPDGRSIYYWANGKRLTPLEQDALETAQRWP